MTEDEEFEANIENDPEFILSQLREGTVLTAEHIKAIAFVLNKIENDLHDDLKSFEDGRISALREIGGEDLVTAVQLKEDEQTAHFVRKAMDRMFPKRNNLQ